MRIGLHPGEFLGDEPIAERLRTNLAAAEDIGVHSVWFMDHLFQIGGFGEPEDPMLEAYTSLAWAAALTSRMQLGVLVTAVPYRSPGMLVKTVTTLDVLSGGRAWLGIGAAWNDHEARSLGLDFPPLAERFEQLEDVLALAEQMFVDDATPFAGRRFRLTKPINHPLPVRRPPILIGGGGERKTLRLVARHADACNLWENQVQRKLDVLADHCEREGRTFEDIVVTTTGRLDPRGSAERAIEKYGRLAEMGVDMAIVTTPEPFHRHAGFLAEVIHGVAGLGRPSPPQLDGAPGGVHLAPGQA